MKQRKQSTSTYPFLFLLVLSTDHITGAIGKTVTVTISKNGAGYGTPSGAITELANGVYQLAGNTTDTNTLGEFWLHATATGCDPVDDRYEIVLIDPFGANLGLSNLDAAVSTRLATSGYTVPDNTSIATLLTRVDVVLSTRLALAGYTAPDNSSIASILARTDVATSTRLATSGYTAPDNTGIGNIYAKTDVATSTRLAAGSYTAPDNASIATLLSRIDVILSTRLAAADYTAPSNASIATILGRVDVTLSTRLAGIDYTAPDNAGIATLLLRLTNARGLLLDNLSRLDVLLSSRLAEADYVVPDNTTIGILADRLTEDRANLIDALLLLDVAVSTRLAAVDYTPADSSGVTELLDRLTEERAESLDHLDEDISSRLAAADYNPVSNAPTVEEIRTEMDDNSTKFASIVAKTAQLVFVGGRVNANASITPEDLQTIIDSMLGALGSTVVVYIVTPLAPDGKLSVRQGDVYGYENVSPIKFYNNTTDIPDDISGWTAWFVCTATFTDKYEISADIIVPTGNRRIDVKFHSEESNLFETGNYSVVIKKGVEQHTFYAGPFRVDHTAVPELPTP